jgi:predicted AAA+ superfamily ATPase
MPLTAINCLATLILTTVASSPSASVCWIARQRLNGSWRKWDHDYQSTTVAVYHGQSALTWPESDRSLIDYRPYNDIIPGMLFPRNLKTKILTAANDTPVIMVNGARQTGKSTLMQGLFPANEQPAYVTFDDMNALGLARSAPQIFVESLPERVILDEIQRLPELFLPIKLSVDQNRKPGRFFITGSANILGLPKVSESLAGRIEIHTLWPLSQGEIRCKREGFVDALFSNENLPAVKPATILDVLTMASIGGYPDVQSRKLLRRKDWFASYITTLMERDVRDLSNIEQLTALPNLLALLASRAGGMLNNSDLSRSLELSLSTLKRYLSLLELLFLVVPLRPWF